MAELLAFHRKRRGVVKASLTKLGTKLTELEANKESPTLMESASGLADKLKVLQQEYRNHQLSIIDRTEGEEALAEEQQALDDQDDQFSTLHVHIQRLITLATPSPKSDVIRVASKQITHLQGKLKDISASVAHIDDSHEDSTCELEEYRDQLVELKSELCRLKDDLLSSDASPEGLVMQNLTSTDKSLFKCLLAIKKRLRSAVTPRAAVSDTTTTKLPKLELPTFHGDIL